MKTLKLLTLIRVDKSFCCPTSRTFVCVYCVKLSSYQRSHQSINQSVCQSVSQLQITTNFVEQRQFVLKHLPENKFRCCCCGCCLPFAHASCAECHSVSPSVQLFNCQLVNQNRQLADNCVSV